MNYPFLLRQSATHLYTSARMYDTGYHLLDACTIEPALKDDELAQAILRSDLIHQDASNMPRIFSVNHTLIFAWIKTPEHFFLLGPTFFAPFPAFTTDLGLPDIQAQAMLDLVPKCNMQILADDCALLFNLDRTADSSFQCLQSQRIIEANLLPQEQTDQTMKTLHQTIFQNVENSFVHNPYNHEKLEVNAIRSGDVETLKTALEIRFPGRYGKLSNDRLRNELYLAVVNVTLASRAAIDGGLHPETAFYLSDVSIQRIDACRDPNEIIRRTKDAQLHFAEAVRDLKSDVRKDMLPKENAHIVRCKDYIFAHLHGKVSVRQIADAIGLEANYLSALFKRYEKITLKQYITQEKVKLIKNMLTYSDYTFAEIAAYLGFSSQSHMGMDFKRITGQTLGEYRNRYGKGNF